MSIEVSEVVNNDVGAGDLAKVGSIDNTFPIESVNSRVTKKDNTTKRAAVDKVVPIAKKVKSTAKQSQEVAIFEKYTTDLDVQVAMISGMDESPYLVIGEILLKAKSDKQLPKPEFKELKLRVSTELDFNSRNIDKLVSIAGDDNIKKHRDKLPKRWGTLYLMVGLPPKDFKSVMGSKEFSAEITREKLNELVAPYKKPKVVKENPKPSVMENEVKKAGDTALPPTFSSVDRKLRAIVIQPIKNPSMNDVAFDLFKKKMEGILAEHGFAITFEGLFDDTGVAES